MLKLRILLRPVFSTRAYNAGVRYTENEIDFVDEPLPERNVVKDVYKESETTASRSDEEIEDFKNKHNVTVKGRCSKGSRPRT